MNEFFNTLRSVHLLNIAVSLAIGAFALSPRDAQLFRAAEQEAQFLAQLNFDTFSNVVLEVRRESIKQYSAQLIGSLQKQNYNIKIDDAVKEKIIAPLLVWWPKKNDSIAKIREFIDDSEHQLLAARHINGQDSRSIWREVFGDAQHNALCFVHREEIEDETITALEPCSPLTPGGELTEIAIEELYSGPPAKIQMETETHRLAIESIIPGTFTLVFSVRTGDRTVRYAMPQYVIGPVDGITKRSNLVCLWLLQYKAEVSPIKRESSDALKPANLLKVSAKPRSPTSRCFSISNSSYFQRVFPNLDVLWSQVSKLTPEQAAEQLSVKSMQSRQSMSIAGLSIDERILSIAAPVAIMSISLYLLVNLMMLRSTISDSSDRTKPYPWFCLYKDPLSRFLTVFTILVLPATTLVVLLAKIDGQWNVSTAFGHIALLLVGFIGYRSLRVLDEIRRYEPPPPTFTLQSTFPIQYGQTYRSH